jgi:phosphinothricin acetyltransferase
MPAIPEFRFRPFAETDRAAVIDLFNDYIGNSYAAYPENPVPYSFFDLFLEISRQYPSVIAELPDGNLAGFGLLRPHNPMPVFRHTAEVTYFVRPDLTGNGLGSAILARLEKEGKERGITTILASISSLNEESIRFHARHGFTGCGRFTGVGIKKGTIFDTVWMQKFL